MKKLKRPLKVSTVSGKRTFHLKFVSPHRNHGDVIYDQPYNANFSDKIESVKYNAALGITGAIRRASKEKLYQELGLDTLRNGRWLRRLSYLCKIISNKLSNFLYELSTPLQTLHLYPGCFETSLCRT